MPRRSTRASARRRPRRTWPGRRTSASSWPSERNSTPSPTTCPTAGTTTTTARRKRSPKPPARGDWSSDDNGPRFEGAGMISNRGGGPRSPREREKERDAQGRELIDRVVHINRVTKVVKG